MNIEIKQRIQTLLKDDPLLAVIFDTPLETVLYSDSYLSQIVEKKFYSTPQVAKWFDISDAQLRYYIKPFEDYLFTKQDDTPTTPSAIRLNFPAILKLRMILLLKDEYRVKGITQLIEKSVDNSITSSIQPAIAREKTIRDSSSDEVEIISEALYQILHTGLFDVQKEDGKTQVRLNTDMLTQLFQSSLPNREDEKRIEKIQSETEKLEKENKVLKFELNQLTKRMNSKQDIAVKLRERHIESRVVSKLRAEGVNEFSNQRNFGFLKRLFYSTQIEKEKEIFVAEYIDVKLYEELQRELTNYHV